MSSFFFTFLYIFLLFFKELFVSETLNCRNINIKLEKDPSFRVIQLTPTSGRRPQRTVAFKVSCLVMKSAIGGE